MTIRPGTSEVWLGDVGWNSWEEINRIANPLGSIENFGWPCYEGVGHQSGYDSANLNICENLYAQGTGAVVPPYYTYNHSAKVVPSESCPPNPDGTGASSSVAGVAFYTGGPFPNTYDGALFFADYSRDCIWVMFPGTNGLPNPSDGFRTTFQAPAANPVDLQVGPDGALYYADFDGGTIRRIAYSANQPPIASATGSPTNGPAPLTVNFNGSGSSDPEGGPLTYAWDLDGDGAFDDSTAVQPTHTYTQPGTYSARLRVTDAQNQSATSAPITISADNSPPTATINAPAAGTTWKVDDFISFDGSATDPQQGTLSDSALSWQLIQHHCPSDCHTHLIQTWGGDPLTWFFNAPDHEYPSYLELRLTATDGGGLTDTETLQLDPRTVALSFQSSPAGLQLVVGGSSSITPFTRTVIEGSTNSISAPTPQILNGTSYAWVSWSDGGAQSHNIVASASATYTAAYANQPPIASATGSPMNGPAPLTVNFDGSGSSDPQGGPLTYAWDLDGDGAFDDSTAVQPTHTYTQPGTYSARLRVTDAQNQSSTSAPVTISAVPSPQRADLALAKTGAMRGSNALWNLSVRNVGPNGAQNVVVTDTLPSRVSFVSALGCTYVSSTRTVRCGLAALAQSGTASFTITTSVSGKGNGWITNTAQTSSSTPDPSTANNIAGARVRIGPSAWVDTATVEVAANGRALILLKCRASTGGCRGSITFERRVGAPRTRAGRRHRLSSGSFLLRAGDRRRVPVRLTSRGLALLRARHRLSVRAVVVSRDASGHRTTASRLVVLRTLRSLAQRG
jgi:uncharacterized repeat protein (TIGR01451 family)